MCVCYTVVGGQLLIFDFIHSQSYVWPPARPSSDALFVSLKSGRPLFNRGSGRLKDWIKCFYESVHAVLMFPTLIPNTCSHYRSMPIIHFLHLLSQLTHARIAAPEISSMTAIIAFPPIAVCLQRCCQCDVLLIKFDCWNVQVLNQAKAFQPLIVETLAV